MRWRDWFWSLLWRAELPTALPTDPAGLLWRRCAACEIIDWRWRLKVVMTDVALCRNSGACYQRSQRRV